MLNLLNCLKILLLSFATVSIFVSFGLIGLGFYGNTPGYQKEHLNQESSRTVPFVYGGLLTALSVLGLVAAVKENVKLLNSYGIFSEECFVARI